MKTSFENPLHVLLADDDSDDTFLFNEALEQSVIPATFSHAENGQELLKFLETEAKPDILFLDVNMPFKNGIECLHEIRSKAVYKDLPIVIYSTTNYQVNVEECYRGGANLYVIKPNTFDEILKMINTVCKSGWLNEKERSPEQFLLNTFE